MAHQYLWLSRFRVVTASNTVYFDNLIIMRMCAHHTTDAYETHNERALLALCHKK